MNLSIGVSLMCLSAVLFGIEMLYFRNPKLPHWAEGFVVISMGVMAVLGLGVSGLMLITFAFEQIGAIGYYHLLLSAALVGATVLILWFLHIPKKLKAYADQKADVLSFKPAEAPVGPGSGLTAAKGRLAA